MSKSVFWAIAVPAVLTLFAILPVGVEVFRRLVSRRVRPWEIGPLAFSEAKSRIDESKPAAEDPVPEGTVTDYSAAVERVLGPSVRSAAMAAPMIHRKGATGSYVATRDVSALEAVKRLFWRMQGDGEPTQLVDAAQINLPTQDSLILVCSPIRNLTSQALLAEHGLKSVVQFDYLEASDGISSRILRFGDDLYVSTFLRQLADSVNDPTGHEGGFDDFGVICKVTNPWNPDAKFIFLSGIHSLGTWGAGEALQQHIVLLASEFGASDFSVLIKAHADDLNKGPVFTDVVKAIKLHDLPAPYRTEQRGRTDPA